MKRTRKQEANELIERLQEGPSFSDTIFVGQALTVEEVTRQYRRWANSWVVPAVKRLVPELKDNP